MSLRRKSNKRIEDKKIAVSAASTQLPASEITVKQQQIQERRDKVYRMMLRGFHRSQLASMFGVSVRTIDDDLAFTRKEVLEQAIQRKDYSQDEIAEQKLQELAQLKSDFYTLRTEAKSDPAKIQAMHGVLATIQQETKLLEKIGLLPKDSLEAELKQSVQVFFNIARPKWSPVWKKDNNNN